MHSYEKQDICKLIFTKAGFLLSVKAVVVLILYTLILPLANKTSKSSIEISNVLIAKVSILLLSTGTLIMGISWNLFVLTPGQSILFPAPKSSNTYHQHSSFTP